MPEPPHNNLCLPVKRLKNIIARQQEVEGIAKVDILFFGSGEINLFLCWFVFTSVGSVSSGPVGYWDCTADSSITCMSLHLVKVSLKSWHCSGNCIYSGVFFSSTLSEGFSPAGTLQCCYNDRKAAWVIRPVEHEQCAHTDQRNTKCAQTQTFNGLISF